MYNLTELSTEQKVELELILKAGYEPDQARKASEYLLKNSDGSESVEMFEGSGFVKFTRDCGDVTNIRVSAILGIEDNDNEAVIILAGHRIYTTHTVQSVISMLKQYKELYGYC